MGGQTSKPPPDVATICLLTVQNLIIIVTNQGIELPQKKKRIGIQSLTAACLHLAGNPILIATTQDLYIFKIKLPLLESEKPIDILDSNERSEFDLAKRARSAGIRDFSNFRDITASITSLSTDNDTTLFCGFADGRVGAYFLKTGRRLADYYCPPPMRQKRIFSPVALVQHTEGTSCIVGWRQKQIITQDTLGRACLEDVTTPVSEIDIVIGIKNWAMDSTETPVGCWKRPSTRSRILVTRYRIQLWDQEKKVFDLPFDSPNFKPASLECRLSCVDSACDVNERTVFLLFDIGWIGIFNVDNRQLYRFIRVSIILKIQTSPSDM